MTSRVVCKIIIPVFRAHDNFQLQAKTGTVDVDLPFALVCPVLVLRLGQRGQGRSLGPAQAAELRSVSAGRM